MSRIKLELHNVVHKGQAIEDEIGHAIEESIGTRVAFLEILFEKNDKELKNRALRFLAQTKIKQLYHRVEKDENNFEHIFVHFKPRSNRKKIGLYGYPA